jgi:gamma-glutamyl hercynylcysteine S-oxide hydrolase
MCRHLGHIGPARSLAALLFDPPHSLERQAWEPRFLDVGRINADGWGVGWYDPSVGREPARYRTATPIWADHRFAGVARHVRASHILAAVRNASPGLPVEDSGAAPFIADHYLFSHNGSVDGWHDGVGLTLRRGLSPRREAIVGGRSDSEVLFAMILDGVDAGAPLDEAVAGVVDEVATMAGGRFNLLLSDGETIIATRHGCSLFVLADRGDQVMVASEPLDEGPGWYPVPERSLVALTAGSVSITPL